MTRKTITAGAHVASAVLSLAVAQNAFGQAAATPAAAPAAEGEELVVLSPFVVSAAEDGDSYKATSTLAGTRVRTELKDVGSSISVVTDAFLKDTGSKNAETLLVYTPSTEVAGQGGNFLGQGDGAILTSTNRTSPIANTRVRGLTEADNTRDFFLSDIPWDSYNVGRIDLQRGPNSVLFGIGSPAGIVNASLNTAALVDSNKVENQIDNFGTLRFSGDFNKVLVPNQLAVRLSLLNDETKYKQDPAFKHDKRAYGALTWKPSFLNGNGIDTTLRGNYEYGRIRSNNPRSTPPLDGITPWYTSMGKATYDAQTSQDAAATQPWLGAPGQRVWDGVVTTYSGGAQGFSFPAKVFGWPTTTTPVPASVVGNNVLKGVNTYNQYASRASLEFADINAYKARSLTDASVFDFYNNLLEGPNKREWNDFRAFNVALAQTYFDNKLGLELAYDNQDTRWGYENFISGDAAMITVDIMATLIDGSANPNVGRPMAIAGGGDAGGYRAHSQRETLRATAFGELNLRDLAGKDSFLGRVFGRNVVTGLLTRQTQDLETRNYNRYYLASSYAPNATQGAVGQASRDNIFYLYLGEKLDTNAGSPADIGLTGVKSRIEPQGGSITVYNNVDNAWQAVPLDIVNNDHASARDKTYRLARKYRDRVDSSAIVWQGYWFDDCLVPMVGLRRDKDIFRDAGNPPGAGGLVHPYDPSWQLPEEGNEVSGTSKTYSIVTHLPKSWRQALPGRADLSFFANKSANFRPDSSRRDILGNSVGNPSGKTKEYGAALSIFDDKLSIKWIHYKTTVSNATLDGAIGGQYLIGAVEAWGQRAAYKFRDQPGTWPASTIFGYATSGEAVTWRPAGAEVKDGSGNYAYSQAVLDQTYARQQASIAAWFASQVPAGFQDAWALTGYDTAAYDGSTNYGASGLVVTGDTISTGNEFEIVASPVKGLNISFNASKTSAQRTNLAQSYVDWIEMRWTQFQGPAGEMRLWGGDEDWSVDSAHSGETARGKFSRETMSGYNLWKALQGADVPELRPWRFNVVANYGFQSGALRGANLGASYRWQDAAVVGFPVITDADGNHVYDVQNPYKGESEDAIDLWIGYERNLTEKIKWRIQLNVRNVFASKDLLPVTVQPDGTYGALRIPEPRTFSLTNTFTF